MIITEFWGTPSSGKSVMSAKLYSKLSLIHPCKLITEFIKDYSDRGLPIESQDQLWILGNQSRFESATYGKYDYVFEDSSMLIGGFYTQYYSKKVLDLTKMILEYEKFVDNKFNIIRNRVFLRLNPDWFQDTGRYQGKEESIAMEQQMIDYLIENKVDFSFCDRNVDAILEYVQYLNGVGR